MREMMWIYAVFIILLSEAWSKKPVIRHSAFNLGSDVNLTCSEKTWSETLFVIWEIHLKYKHCKIAFIDIGPSEDSCNDGKSVRNTSSAQSFLHIPKFSNDDVGTYKCELVYRGGNDNQEIDVAITVPPSISSWLEHRDNKIVAVCKAERGKPAANISWSHALNSTSVDTLSGSDGFFTVESHLELPEGVDIEKLRCTVSHLSWPEEQILEPKLKKGYVPWLFIIIAAAVFVLLTGIVFVVQKKRLLRRCQQSNASPSKSALSEDAEEVEPYACYVQQENSIYNSFADLFT